MVFTIINQKKIKFYYLRNSSPGIFENALKKENIFKNIKLENLNSIETFFRFTKIQYFINAWPDSLKIVLSGRIRQFKRIKLKGRGF